jgi:hypothetical protein
MLGPQSVRRLYKMGPILDPRFPFGRLPSDRPEVPIVLFETPELGTMLPPFPSLRLEAVVERSYSACYIRLPFSL